MEYRTAEDYEAETKRPGKFEGAVRYAPYFYEVDTDGGADDYTNTPFMSWSAFIITKEDVSKFPELVIGEVVVLSEDGNGFVDACSCTMAEWEHFDAEIESEESHSYDNE